MNILVASESFYPAISGVSVTAERLAANMAERGHKVMVIAPSRNRSFFKENRRGYTIYRIPSWPNPFRKGFRFTLFPYKYVKEIFRQVEPDLIHIHDPAMLCTTVAKWGRKRQVPVVVTNHFTFEYLLTYLPWLKPVHPLIRSFLKWDVERFYNTCSILTVPTQTTKEYLEKDSAITIPIEVISNGVDMSRFALYYRPTVLMKRYAIPANLPVIAYIGRIDKEKNLPVLLEAMALVLKKTSAILVMLGGGNCVEELKEYAQELGIQDSIIWIARVDNGSTLLNQLYHITTLFCIPSPIETESMVTMEAMASGLPVVAAKSGALPELVHNGENGFLVDPYEAASWAKAITTILDDDELRSRMARRSIELIAARDISATMDKFEKLYTSAIKLKVASREADRVAPV